MGLDIYVGSLTRYYSGQWDAMRTWRDDPPAGVDAVEYGARFAFAILTELSRLAVAHRLVLKLDY
jgi:hypothetical protein